jgi:hypothetical protein
LPERLAGALRTALLEMDDRATLDALGADGFVAGSDEDFLTIRVAIEQNSRFFH